MGGAVQTGSEAGVAGTMHSDCQVSCQGGPTLASSELEEFQQEADLLLSLISFFLLFFLSSKRVWSGLYQSQLKIGTGERHVCLEIVKNATFGNNCYVFFGRIQRAQKALSLH